MRERKLNISEGLESLSGSQEKARKAGVEPPDILAEAKRQAGWIQRNAPELLGEN
jgi:F0F1-type ATP synthase membrane subunit b/b'